MLNIGITGQAGFVGYHLYNKAKLNTNFNLINFEDEFFYKKEVLKNFVKQCDVIIHLAAVNRHHDQNEIFNKNIELVDRLIEAMNETNSKAHVFFSSSTQEERNNIYGNSKKAGREKLIKWATENSTGFTGLIIPNVFGPFGRPFYNSVISTFSYQVVSGDTPKIEIDATLNLIYVGELVDFIIKKINNDYRKIEQECLVPHTFTIKVTDILDKLIYFKKNYIENGIIPKLENNFDINLFNTFRSYIDNKSFYPVKYKKNSDDRGDFVEVMRLNIGGQVSFSTTKPGIVRGNHFHTRKIERFAVIKGKALIQLRKIGTNDVINFELDGNEPAYVDMPIWFTHNIKNIGNEDLYTMFWINEFYNAEDPDTYFEAVEI
ncbi:MAG TPA: NAD-dependent epimerase/dehydratase family protein [Melioribacteraceae bacterium]|nr:NAD-dependent epimerase/dehydratase family protein [Melioribacteraceae bacterium]